VYSWAASSRSPSDVAGEGGGLEQAVGLAELGEAGDQGGGVLLGAGEGDLAGEQGGARGRGLAVLGDRYGDQRGVDRGERGGGVVGLVLERVGEGARQFEDAGGGLGAVGVGLGDGGVRGLAQALLEQGQALVEAAALADEAAEAEQDVVVLGGLGGEGLEGARGRRPRRRGLLAGRGPCDQQGDAAVAVARREQGEALVDDREERAVLLGLEVEALELGERLGVLGAAGLDVGPGGDRLGDVL
jgi:hypothetical protein